ncbi:ER membrane protein complex subunit 7 [Fasciolopsis buskii]|uniref:ER membrane protein complex subunit 7 n=1 Tax=Fasciolopsis buskii TaxID=27845 RepID=A0A8E0RUF4_9TREM|nr:ER membrane protein complex subunit 7 [Fasciolopsis buski]
MIWTIVFPVFLHVSSIHGHVLEGVLIAPKDAPADWFVHTRIHIDGSQYVGFVQPDGYFEVSGVPFGSYVVEPIHPSYVFQTARVDINSKGRIRARRVNAPQPNAVKELPYPLRLSSAGNAVYFKPREQLRTLDVLFSPSVLYILVPLLVVMALTRLINTNDPELQKELQQMNRQQKLPDLSEMLSSLSMFGNSKKSTIETTHTRRRLTDDTRSSTFSHDVGSGSHSDVSPASSSGRKLTKRKN